MDMPPPQNINPISQVNIIEYNSSWEDGWEFVYLLSFVDSSSIPDKVKLFAKDNDCRYLKKNYYWSYKLYKNNGSIYYCSKDNKTKFIYDNNKKPRFAKWYETYKIRHTAIYE